jgi:hypothetical protein
MTGVWSQRWSGESHPVPVDRIVLTPSFTPLSACPDIGRMMLMASIHRDSAMSKPDDKNTPRNPRELDAGTGDRVEKKPKDPESPQQTHEDESHG